MRRIAIGLIFLLGACADKPQQEALSVNWNEHRSFGDQQQHWYTDGAELTRVDWNSGSRAFSASSRQIPDLADPTPFDGAALGKFTPTETKALSASASQLKTLTEASNRVVQFQPDEASRLGNAASVSFPTEWQ